jgi:hypothetical protein
VNFDHLAVPGWVAPVVGQPANSPVVIPADDGGEILRPQGAVAASARSTPGASLEEVHLRIPSKSPQRQLKEVLS